MTPNFFWQNCFFLAITRWEEKCHKLLLILFWKIFPFLPHFMQWMWLTKFQKWHFSEWSKFFLLNVPWQFSMPGQGIGMCEMLASTCCSLLCAYEKKEWNARNSSLKNIMRHPNMRFWFALICYHEFLLIWYFKTSLIMK